MVTRTAGAAGKQAAQNKVLRYLDSKMHARTIGEVSRDLDLSPEAARVALRALVEDGKVNEVLHHQLPEGLQKISGRTQGSVCFATPEKLALCVKVDREWDEQARTEDRRMAAELAAFEALKERYPVLWDREYQAELARLNAKYVAEPYRRDGLDDGRWCVVVVNGHARNVLTPIDPASPDEDQPYGTREEAMRGAAHWNECDPGADTASSSD